MYNPRPESLPPKVDTEVQEAVRVDVPVLSLSQLQLEQSTKYVLVGLVERYLRGRSAHIEGAESFVRRVGDRPRAVRGLYQVAHEVVNGRPTVYRLHPPPALDRRNDRFPLDEPFEARNQHF